MMKKCTKCAVSKPLSDFYERKKGSGLYMSDCKECVKKRTRKWELLNPEKVKKKNRAYRIRNRSAHAEYERKRRAANSELYKEASRRWRSAHPERAKEVKQRYCKKSKEKIKEYNQQYAKNNYCSIKLKRKIHRRANREQMNKRERKRRAALKFSPRSQYKKRPESELIKHAAHAAVARALKVGRKQKPTICSYCKEDKFPIEAHHYDYLKPLDVTWLCKSCHMELHKGKGGSLNTPCHKNAL